MTSSSVHRIAGAHPATLALVLASLVCTLGCKTTDTGLPEPLPNREERMQHGYLYYLDGAGGGTSKKNWAGGVREGFLGAGYKGAGELYSWEKGEGMMKDQDAALAYKRNMAKGLAFEIQQYVTENPGAPVGILGFSAGTAEAIFALEVLPEAVKADNVVLLGASISADYDMTAALKSVRNKLYVYTSTHDRMLGVLMPLSVTADLKKDVPGAGIDGFVLPPGASDETRRLYASKIVAIRWDKELEKDGDYGHHFDNVKMPFIRDHVAPLFMGKSVPLLKAPAESGPNAAPPELAPVSPPTDILELEPEPSGASLDPDRTLSPR